jgi:hypothetical protein
VDVTDSDATRPQDRSVHPVTGLSMGEDGQIYRRPFYSLYIAISPPRDLLKSLRFPSAVLYSDVEDPGGSEKTH